MSAKCSLKSVEAHWEPGCDVRVSKYGSRWRVQVVHNAVHAIIGLQWLVWTAGLKLISQSFTTLIHKRRLPPWWWPSQNDTEDDVSALSALEVNSARKGNAALTVIQIAPSADFIRCVHLVLQSRVWKVSSWRNKQWSDRPDGMFHKNRGPVSHVCLVKYGSVIFTIAESLMELRNWPI